MPAHTRPLLPRKCSTCGRPATVSVFNRHNAHIGDYCRKHGTELVKTLEARP
jgi:hypothetical protein